MPYLTSYIQKWGVFINKKDNYAFQYEIPRSVLENFVQVSKKAQCRVVITKLLGFK